MNLSTKKQQDNTYYRFCAHFAATIAMVFGLTSCFLFDDGTTEGFTIDGVYDGGSYNKVGNCSSTQLNSELEYYQESYNFNNKGVPGSLLMRMLDNCFSPNTRSGFNRFDFVSPILTDWNNAIGYQYVVKTNVPSITVQSLLKVRKANGDIVMKQDTSSEPPFILLSPLHTWKKIKFVRPSIEAGEKVVAVHVRVFISNEALNFTGPEAIIQLDQVVQTLDLN